MLVLPHSSHLRRSRTKSILSESRGDVATIVHGKTETTAVQVGEQKTERERKNSKSSRSNYIQARLNVDFSRKGTVLSGNAETSGPKAVSHGLRSSQRRKFHQLCGYTMRGGSSMLVECLAKDSVRESKGG
uniref:Uncharacterized protein n=1 Tax=Vespula pensylvanica TaxID=30213 RepID=A0A834PCH7_VESPE|nr:hypothetical protein H0235_003713 [Vespula pensylvanica]